MCDHGRGLDGWTVARGRARQAQSASGELRAEIDGSGGGGGGMAYEARGYKQGWADERAGRQASRVADGPWLVRFVYGNTTLKYSQNRFYSEKKLRNNLWQFVYAYMPLSPCTMTWYRPRGQWCSAAGKVTAGLADSLLPDGWLIVTYGLTACTPGSTPGPTLHNEYGKPLPLFTFLVFFIDGVNATVRVAIRPPVVEWHGRHLKQRK